jgi:hypothetical protein
MLLSLINTQIIYFALGSIFYIQQMLNIKKRRKKIKKIKKKNFDYNKINKEGWIIKIWNKKSGWRFI